MVAIKTHQAEAFLRTLDRLPLAHCLVFVAEGNCFLAWE